MSRDHFQLTAVQALPASRLLLTYADWQSFEVDLRQCLLRAKLWREAEGLEE